MLKKIGTQARIEMENLLDMKVNLQLWVKVKKHGETAICCLRTMDMIRKKYKDVTRDQSDGNGLTGWQYWGV